MVTSPPQAYATVVAQENPSTADLATAADPEDGDSQFEEVAILPKTGSPINEDDDSDIEIVDFPKPKSKRRKGSEETEKLEVPCIKLSRRKAQLRLTRPTWQTEFTSSCGRSDDPPGGLPRHVHACHRHGNAGGQRRCEARSAFGRLRTFKRLTDSPSLGAEGHDLDLPRREGTRMACRLRPGVRRWHLSLLPLYRCERG